MEVVASLSQGRTAAAQCGLFTYKSDPVIFEPPCTSKSSSAPFSKNAYSTFPPLMLETKFHTHINQLATLCFQYFDRYVF